MAIRAQNCGPRSVVADFRQWVGQLTEKDGNNLKNLELNLRKLRMAAMGGKVYGFIHTVTGRDKLIELLEMKEIRMAYIIENVPGLSD